MYHGESQMWLGRLPLLCDFILIIPTISWPLLCRERTCGGVGAIPDCLHIKATSLGGGLPFDSRITIHPVFPLSHFAGVVRFSTFFPNFEIACHHGWRMDTIRMLRSCTSVCVGFMLVPDLLCVCNEKRSFVHSPKQDSYTT